jgi:hypothetical protein
VSFFRVFITDQEGVVVAAPERWEDTEVVIPLNDSRTARTTISLHDVAAAQVTPLDRLLKVYYGSLLVFWGYILNPIWDAAAGTVEINAHDPTIKLKHHFHRYGDTVVENVVPVNGTGMRNILLSAAPTLAQQGRGVLSHGIEFGTDTTTDHGVNRVPIERGTNVWESLLSLSESAIGPDFEFVPDDTLDPHAYVVFNTADTLGTDITDDVVFHYGFGVDNLENFVYSPDGDAVRNYMVVVPPGGTTDSTDTRRALSHSEASWLQYGIYQGWESSGQRDVDPAYLQQIADAWVDAYAEVPKFFQIDPKPDHPRVPVYGSDFNVGDTIRAAVKQGQLAQEVEGRIVSVTLSQANSAAYVNASLECTPNVGTVLTSGEDG